MNTSTTKWAVPIAALALVVGACASSETTAVRSRQPLPYTPSTDGVTEMQAVAFEDVVERIAAARCDRDQSCDRIGPGATYPHRDDCMREARAIVSRDLNPQSCPGGVGEAGVRQCVSSLIAGECDMPGQVYGRVSSCKLAALCMKR